MTENVSIWEVSDGLYRDFVLSGQVGPFAQQLALRQREDARRLSDQDRVVQAIVTWSRRDQVPTLNEDRARGMSRSAQLIYACCCFMDSFVKSFMVIKSFIELGMSEASSIDFLWK